MPRRKWTESSKKQTNSFEHYLSVSEQHYLAVSTEPEKAAVPVGVEYNARCLYLTTQPKPRPRTPKMQTLGTAFSVNILIILVKMQ